MAEQLGRVGAWYKAKRFQVGGVGEKVVGKHLSELPRDAWSWRHDVPLSASGANADHVVVGPSGVFCLNTKFLSGEVSIYPDGVRVDGHLTDYVGKAVAAARTVRELLQARCWFALYVQPVLVFVRQRLGFFGTQKVLAYGDAELVPALLRRPVALAGHELSLLRAAVEDPRTWRR